MIFKKQYFTFLHTVLCCPFLIFFACSPTKIALSILSPRLHTVYHCMPHTVCVRAHFLLVCGPFSKLFGCDVCVLKHSRFVHLHEHLGTQPKGLSALDSVLKSPLKRTFNKLLEGESKFFLTFIPGIMDVCGSWLWSSRKVAGNALA